MTYAKTHAIAPLETLSVKGPSGQLVMRWTVEEIGGGFIATEWDCDCELEVDRHVETFETYSGALCEMYRNALAYIGVRLENGLEFSAKTK